MAGHRNYGESVEQTAQREGREESGRTENFNLLPPTVIVKAVKKDKLGIGVIFPTIVPENHGFTPNEEISQFGWFNWGSLAQMMDYEMDIGADYEMWGSEYTWALLSLWHKCVTGHDWVKDSEGKPWEMMNRIVSVETGLGIGAPTPYDLAK